MGHYRMRIVGEHPCDISIAPHPSHRPTDGATPADTLHAVQGAQRPRLQQTRALCTAHEEAAVLAQELDTAAVGSPAPAHHHATRCWGPLPDPVPVPLASTLHPNALQREDLQALTDHAYDTLYERLVRHPQELPILAMSGNPPDVEVLFHTKIAVQYSYCNKDAAAQPVLDRHCNACVHQFPTADRLRLRRCTSAQGSNCLGCVACVGTRYHCPNCETMYDERYHYEAGSALGSVNRDREDVEILVAPPHIAELLRKSAGQPGTNCVMVTYLGKECCAYCIAGKDHEQCGSVLKGHRDNCAGANCQDRAPNTTTNVGHTRQLSMALDGHQLASGENFQMTAGSVFILHPNDEVDRPRTDGRNTHFKHGMCHPLDGGQVSVGFVCRPVQTITEVNRETNRRIMSAEEWHAYHKEPPPSRYGLPVNVGPPQGSPRVAYYTWAKQNWSCHAAKFGRVVQLWLERARREWSDALRVYYTLS